MESQHKGCHTVPGVATDGKLVSDCFSEAKIVRQSSADVDVNMISRLFLVLENVCHTCSSVAAASCGAFGNDTHHGEFIISRQR